MEYKLRGATWKPSAAITKSLDFLLVAGCPRTLNVACGFPATQQPSYAAGSSWLPNSDKPLPSVA